MDKLCGSWWSFGSFRFKNNVSNVKYAINNYIHIDIFHIIFNKSHFIPPIRKNCTILAGNVIFKHITWTSYYHVNVINDVDNDLHENTHIRTHLTVDMMSQTRVPVIQQK